MNYGINILNRPIYFYLFLFIFDSLLKNYCIKELLIQNIMTTIKSRFITFGSHANYVDAGNRLVNQANQLNIFTECRLYRGEHLMHSEFWNQHSNFINHNRRGFGYWIWKSYIIKKNMEEMNDGDVLLYLDCGCELDEKCKKEMLKCIEIVKTDKIIGSPLKIQIEKDWCKMDLIEKMKMNKDNINTTQRQGGVNLFLVCPETRQLVNEWYELCCDYHNIDDSPSIIPNVHTFSEHRHDQSIFSLLTKKYNLYSNHIIDNAIYCNRNTSGVSRIK